MTFSPTAASAPSPNILIPLTIESLKEGGTSGRVVFGVDVKKQYYKNVVLEFRVPDLACLRMAHMPILTALRQRDGKWVEVYDQDRHFQQIGQVLESPAWTVDPREQRRLLSTEIEASIGMEFYPFVEEVKERYLDSHDVVLEVTGETFVHEGYPKKVEGITEYGVADFELVRFDSIYIVPKGGPSASHYFS